MTDPIEITTSASHGFAPRDKILVTHMPFSTWTRIKMWLRRPWEWPAKSFDGEYVIGAVTTNTFDLVGAYKAAVKEDKELFEFDQAMRDFVKGDLGDRR